LEGEQERRGKVEGEEETRGRSSETGAKAEFATTISVAKKANTSSVLWQPLITKTNNHTSSKSLKLDIKWEVYKRTQQGVSAKLESFIYKTCLVCATNN